MITGVINSLPILKRNQATATSTGNGAYMKTAATVPSGDLTVFLVGSQAVGTSPLSDNNGTFLQASDSFWFARFGANPQIRLNGTPAKAVTNGTFYTIRAIHDTSGSGTFELATNNDTPVTAATGTLGSMLQLSIFDDGFADWGNKQIAEVIVYTRKLTTLEIADVEDYLKDKFNHY